MSSSESFTLYDELRQESESVTKIDFDLDEKLNLLNGTNAAVVYQLILHHAMLERKKFKIKTKFPYNMNGTNELIHGTTSSFPVELQRIVYVFLKRVMRDG